MKTIKLCSVNNCEAAIGRHGARGMCIAHYRNMMRRGDPLIYPTRRAPGTGWITDDGYKGFTKGTIKTLEHIAQAEMALGKPLPKGAIVHHVDMNPSNNSHSNLVICQNQAYHLLLHVRTRAYNACGNASWRKCKICKTHDDPMNLELWGKEVMHQLCSAQKQRNRIALMKGH